MLLRTTGFLPFLAPLFKPGIFCAFLAEVTLQELMRGHCKAKVKPQEQNSKKSFPASVRAPQLPLGLAGKDMM